ncbi:MAG: hypothetical protein Tsb002_15600 [Wenzhouxiangellaceae bacterium]
MRRLVNWILVSFLISTSLGMAVAQDNTLPPEPIRQIMLPAAAAVDRQVAPGPRLLGYRGGVIAGAPVDEQSGEQCGRVEVLNRFGYNGAQLHPSQATLSREDAGLACIEQDYFGASIAWQKTTLAVGAPGVLSPVADAPLIPASGGELYIYREVFVTPGFLSEFWRWELEQVIRGEDLGLPALGSSVMTDGRQIYAVINDHEIRNTSNGPSTRVSMRGVVAFGRDSAGVWHEQSRLLPALNDQESIRRIWLSGDQLIFALFDQATSEFVIKVYEETDSGAGDWREVQQLRRAGQQAPVELQNALNVLAVSGDFMVMHPRVVPVAGRVDNRAAAVYQRDRAGLWQYHHQVSIAATEATLNQSLGDMRLPWLNSFSDQVYLRGSELLIAWRNLQGSYLPVHYRLDESQQYRASQRLATIDAVIAEADFSTQLLTIRSFSADQGMRMFFADIGTTFTVNRGLTGGWWFGPRRDGQGVGLEILPGNRVQMVWATHDNQGQQMWLYGVGQAVRNRVEIDLVQPVGGQFGADFNPDDVEKLPWGKVEIAFRSCERADLFYNSPEFGSSGLVLFRQTSVDGLDCGDATASQLAQRWTGSWFDPTHNGEGLMMHVTPTSQGPRLSSLWMTYHRDGRQAYLYGSAPVNGNGVINFDRIIRPVGLRFSTVTGQPPLVIPWGQYQLASPECDRAELRYDSLSDAFGRGVQQLERFAIPLGTVCQ